MGSLGDYVDNVANSIEFLQHVVDNWGELPTKDMFDEDDEHVWPQIIELIPEMEENPDFPDVWFGYTEDMLDIVLESKQSIGSEVVPTKLRYIVTTGGPHIEVVADLLSERLYVEGHWSSARSVRAIQSNGLYEHMDHYAEMMCDTLNNYRPSR